MITDIIVWTSAGASLAFVIAWIVRPDVRAWIERPKYHFLASVQQYDRARAERADEEEARR